jgi:hypothetical protein
MGEENRGSQDEARQEDNRTTGIKDRCTERPELQKREGKIWICG